jgi:ribose 5-phosphate isomerase B
MKVALGCDHGGFPLKDAILHAIREAGQDPLDFGTDKPDPVDYPDYAEKVGSAIQSGAAQRGILLCGSGVGACIAANKMKGIYAAVCHDTYSAHQGVEHDDMNVICLGARIVGEELAKEIVKSFLAAHFIGNESGEGRHARRVAKVREIESRSK